MDAVQILSSKGITEENKHNLEALANLLAGYSFRDEKNRLRVTKEIADQVYAISVLLKEVARCHQLVCNKGKTHVESENAWHITKRRRTLSTEPSLETFIHPIEAADYPPLQLTTPEHPAPNHESTQQKSDSSGASSLQHGYTSDEEFWREGTALDDNTCPAEVSGLENHTCISDKATPIRFSPSTAELSADWLLDKTLPNKESMMVIIRSVDEIQTYLEGEIATVLSVYDAGDSAQSSSARLKVLRTMEDLTVPVYLLHPCPPTVPGEKVMIFRGVYASEQKWRFVEPMDESHVLLESERYSMVQPIFAVIRCS